MCVCILHELSNKLCKLKSILGVHKFIMLAVCSCIMRCTAYNVYACIYKSVCINKSHTGAVHDTHVHHPICWIALQLELWMWILIQARALFALQKYHNYKIKII